MYLLQIIYVWQLLFSNLLFLVGGGGRGVLIRRGFLFNIIF